MFVKSVSVHVGEASASIWTLTLEPAGSEPTFTSSGFVPTTVHVTDGSADDTLTDAFDMYGARAGSSISMPLPMPLPTFCTSIVYTTCVVVLAGTSVGTTVFWIDRSASGR